MNLPSDTPWPLACLVLAVAGALSVTAEPQPTPVGKDTGLIPRRVLFGNPDKTSPRLSPDGSQLSYLAAVDGVLNVWVGPADKPEAAQPVTKDTKRGIRSYFWAYTGRDILYTQDADGDEDWHVYHVDLKAGHTKDLTPLEKIAARIEGVSHKFPREILVGLNDRDPKYHDVYRLNIETGAKELIQKNTEFAGFVTDDDYKVRFAAKFTPDGGTAYLKPDGKGGWAEYLKVGMADSLTTRPVAFDKGGEVLYLIDSRGRDTGAVTTLDLASGKQSIVRERSPLTHVGRIRRPLLIGQGANDPRVKQAESDQIVKAMQEKKIPVTYVLLPDEGHGFARPENRLAFQAVTEAFLARHLGGRYKAIGDTFTGSSVTAPAGASDVPGLEAKLPAKK